MTTPDVGTVPAGSVRFTAGPSWTQRVRRLRISVTLSSAFILLMTFVAVFPSWFTSRDPNAGDPLDMLLAPSWEHIFGTDQNGRDIYARIVYGAGPSLLIGVSATLFAVVVGTVIGVFAARGGRIGDWVVSRLLDVFLSIPGLLLVFLIVAARGPGTMTTIIGVAVVTMPSYARLVRGEVIRLRGAVFVEAARALGWSQANVVARHIVPNAIGPVLVLGTIGIGSAIGIASSLSFLGLGPQPPTAEWGSMLSASRTYFSVAWWPAVFPGLAITLTVLSVTVVGRYLQRRNDGRSTP
ncbi:ABC transporter permease [Gordonia sp. KTR9]|uniref:ABC transporter permease n=1 Tax=Gordonia sp. KTR9 TaxID=337191 RepID=UPI00027DDE20|nr:ABC transporter permease [Gordonia sp. KTR9]AFR47282.1 ABC-type dipeptide/oligopeptide/nickel transport systems, permease component [Gordonia sp. KTR9]